MYNTILLSHFENKMLEDTTFLPCHNCEHGTFCIPLLLWVLCIVLLNWYQWFRGLLRISHTLTSLVYVTHWPAEYMSHIGILGICHTLAFMVYVLLWTFWYMSQIGLIGICHTLAFLVYDILWPSSYMSYTGLLGICHISAILNYVIHRLFGICHTLAL